LERGHTAGGANLTLQTNAALHIGMSPTEIVAVIEHAASIAGLPRTQVALRMAQDVFSQRGLALG